MPNVKRYEYRILPIKALDFGSKGSGNMFAEAEDRFNELGRDGFRLAFIAQDPGWTDREGNHWVDYPSALIFEREIDDQVKEHQG